MSFKIYCSLPYFWYRNQTISRVGKSIRTEHFRLRKRGRSMCNTFLFKVKNKVRTLKKNKYSFGSGEYFSISVSLIRILTLNELKLKIILNTQIDYFASYCFISFIKCFPVTIVRLVHYQHFFGNGYLPLTMSTNTSRVKT